jgi:hypothetical protein
MNTPLNLRLAIRFISNDETRISQDTTGQVRSLFEPLAFNVEILSILDGNTRGEIWADHFVKPTVAAIWDQILTLYIAGTH